MKARAATALSYCWSAVRRWLRYTWLSRLPVLEPRPWHRFGRRASHAAHTPKASVRPSLEGLEERWTPNDVGGAVQAPLAAFGLVLLRGNLDSPLHLLAGGDRLTTAARPVPAISELADSTGSDSSKSSSDSDPWGGQELAGLFADGNFLDELSFVTGTNHLAADDGLAGSDATSGSDAAESSWPVGAQADSGPEEGRIADPLSDAGQQGDKRPASPPPAPNPPPNNAGAGGGGGAPGGTSTNNAIGGNGGGGGGGGKTNTPNMNELVQPLGTGSATPANATPANTAAANTGIAPVALMANATALGNTTPTGTVAPLTTQDNPTPTGTAAPLMTPDNPTGSSNGASNSPDGSSNALPQQVGTATLLRIDAAPSAYGQTVTFTATVSALSSSAGTPTGTVLFQQDGRTLADVSLDNGVAVFTTSTLPVGNDAVTAVYQGNGTFLGSQDTTTQNVTREGTSVALTASVSSSAPGQAVTFTATVSALTEGAGTPTGMVDFQDGGTDLGRVSLSGGTVTFTSSTPLAASDHVTAVYEGDGNFLGSQDSVTPPGAGAATSSSNGSGSASLPQGPDSPSVPSISSISPNTDTASGGVPVTISGSGFTGATAVTFGSVAATSFTVNSDTSITAITPAQSAGAVNVTVTTPGGTSAPASFTYTAASTATWVGGSSGYWDVASNWSTGALPTSQNDVVIGSGVTVTVRANDSAMAHSVNCQGSLIVSGGSLSVLGGASIQSLTVSGGSMSVGGNFSAGSPVTISGGSLNLSSGSTTAAFQVGSGATLGLSGYTLAASSSVSGAGTVSFTSSAATTVAGSYTVTNTTINGGTAVFNVDISVQNLTLASGALPGTLTGTGNVTVTGTLTWNGSSTMSGSGSTTVAADATLILNNNTYATTLQLQRVLTNDGSATWTSSYNGTYPTTGLSIAAGAAFNNNGSFSDKTNYSPLLSGSGTFNNSGTYTKDAPASGSAGTTGVTAVFVNTGTVNVNAGSLSLQGGGTASGTFNVDTSATLTFAGSNNNYTLTASSSVSGAGTVSFTSSAATTVAGSYTVTNTTINGGTAVFNVDIGVQNLTLGTPFNQGGTLSGTGNVTVTGTLTWNGSSTMSGSGSTTVAADATLILNNSASYTTLQLQRVLTNDGSATWTSSYNGTYPTTGLSIAAGAAFNNNGSFSDKTNYSPLLSGSGTFNNSGTYTKDAPASGSAGTTGVTAVFVNTGTVNVNAGSLSLQAGGTVDGTFNIATGASLTFIGNWTLTTAPTISGAGTVYFSGTTTLVGAALGNTGGATIGPNTFVSGSASFAGPLTNNGTLVLGNTNAAGTISVNGNYTQASYGTLDDGLGGTTPGSQYSQLNISGTATLAGTLNISRINSYMPANGDTFAVVTFSTSSGTFGTINGLNQGSFTLTAAYQSTDLLLTATVLSGKTSTTTVSSSPNPSVYGQSVTLTATVTGSGGTPTGTVTFFYGGTALGTATLQGGSASLSTTTLPVGSDIVQGFYSGDATFASSSGTLTQTVDAPTVTPSYTEATLHPLTATQGVSYSGTVLDSLYDPDSDTLYSETIDWGDGTATDSQSIGNAASSLPTLSHTYDTAGDYLVTDTLVADRGGALANVVLTTTAVVLPDMDVQADNLTTSSCQTLNAVTAGTFQGPADSTAGDYQATVDWGDGSAAQEATLVSTGSGAFDVVASHTYHQPGTFLTEVRVADRYGDAVDAFGTLTVTPTTAAPDPDLTVHDVQATQGLLYNSSTLGEPLAVFTTDDLALNSGSFAATIDWGDGTESAGAISGSDGSFTINGVHTYAVAGLYEVQVVVTGPTGSARGAASAEVGGAVAFTSEELTLRVGVSGSDVLLATAAGLPADAYAATVDWGDGSVAEDALVTGSAGTLWLAGSHIYTNPGDYLARVRLDDVAGDLLATVYDPVTVTDLAAGQAGGDNFAWFQVQPSESAQAGLYAATIDWGDSEADEAAIDGGGPFFAVAQGQHTYDLEDVYTQQVNFQTSAGTTLATAQRSVQVADAPLTNEDSSLVPVQTTVGAALTAVSVAAFTDEDAGAFAGDFSAVIDWGDGETSEGTMGQTESGAFVVEGDHDYTAAGVYAVSVLIEDKGGASLVSTLPATVAPVTALSLAGSTRTDDPDRALLSPVGEATVDLNQGSVQISQPLDFDQSPGTTLGGSPSLVYNSATVSVRPIVQASLTTGDVPESVTLILTWDGQTLAPQLWTPPAGSQPGQTYTIDVQLPYDVTASGVYQWSLTAQVTLADGSVQQAKANGTAQVVVNDSSPYGAGWGLSSTSRLVFTPTGNVLMVYGDGDSRLFAGNGDGTFTSPAEDFGTLTGGECLGYYLYTAKDQTESYYDLNGRLLSVVQPNGFTLSYSYTDGLLTGVTSPDGGETTLDYTSGLLDQIDEPGGRLVTLEHTGADLTEISDAAGFTRVMSYDGEHHLTEDALAPYDSVFSYDASTDLLTGVTQAPTSYTIVSANSAQVVNAAGAPLATLTDGASHTTAYLLDGRGRALEEIQGDGFPATWTLNDAGDPLSYKDFDGLLTSYTYNGSGDLTQVTYPDSKSETYQYDPTFHEMTQDIDPDGNTTVAQYDDNTGELISQTTGYGTLQAETTTYVWSDGLLQSMTDADGNKTVYSYVGLLLVGQVVYNALGEEQSSQSFSYDDAGNPLYSVDGDGKTNTTHYDGNNNLLQFIDSDGHTTSQEYDAAGLETKMTDGRGIAKDYLFDTAGLETSEVDDANTSVPETMQDGYNGAGNLTSTTDADGNTTVNVYDVDNRLTQTTSYDINGKVISAMAYTYDNNGNVLTTTDGDGNVTTDTYDDRGRVLTETVTDIGGHLISSMAYTYDGNGNVLTSTDGDGNVTSSSYDSNGNVLSQTVRDASGTIISSLAYTYDQDNNVLTSTDGDGNGTSYSYDGDGRVLTTVVRDSQGQLLDSSSYSYDLAGNLLTSTDGDGNVTSYTYDNSGNVLTETVRDASGTLISSLAYTYDQDNNVQTSTDGDGNVTSYSYNGDGAAITDSAALRPLP